MAVERVTVSLEAELVSAVRAAAHADRENVSSWLADAARRRLASRGLRQVIAEWELQQGLLREDELEAARLRLDP